MRVSADVGVAGERTREPARAAAPSWLSPLSLLRTRFRCSALTPLTFAPRELGYKGNAFHTRFEAALARVSSGAYELLCAQPDASRKPYVLVPPLDGLTRYPSTRRTTSSTGDAHSTQMSCGWKLDHSGCAGAPYEDAHSTQMSCGWKRHAAAQDGQLFLGRTLDANVDVAGRPSMAEVNSLSILIRPRRG